MRLKVSNVCQLLDKSKFPATQTVHGVTFTNNGDGTWTVGGTSTARYYSYVPLEIDIDLLRPNHKIVILDIDNPTNIDELFVANYTGGYIAADRNAIYTVPEHEGYRNFRYEIRVYAGKTATNQVCKPQFFDLTEMYGAGNEPTTVEQFREDFPDEMYDYSPECWKRIRRLKYVTETKNLFNIHTEWEYPLSTASQVNLRITDNTITGNISGEGSSAAISTEKIPVQTTSAGEKVYYVSGETTADNIMLVRLTDAEGVLVTTLPGFEYNKYYMAFLVPLNITFYIQNADAVYMQFGVRFADSTHSGVATVTLTNLQFELGSTSTPYQPYGYLPLNRGKYVANKEPVQLYDGTYPATQTVNGVTFTNNGDGSVTVNGTASNTAAPMSKFICVNPGDKILMFSGYDIAGLKSAYVYCAQSNENKKWIADLGYPSLNGRIATCNENCRYISCGYRVDTGNTATNAVIKLQVFNLTQMYGAGNEPTTIAQFRADYPNELYDYNPYNAITFR